MRLLKTPAANTNKENNIEKNAGLLFSHSTGNKLTDLDMFQKVTVAGERITDANLAPYQIDKALIAMIAYQQPAYLEVAEDVWLAPRAMPVGELTVNPSLTISVSEVQQAVVAAVKVIQRFPKVVTWAGLELRQRQLAGAFDELLEQLNGQVPEGALPIKFVTSFMSKSVLDERHPLLDSFRVIGKDISEDEAEDYCLLPNTSAKMKRRTKIGRRPQNSNDCKPPTTAPLCYHRAALCENQAA
ncbi:MAG: indolepyruvate decarboxylase [Neolewinella sp.]|jgi:indolepyruvate decarboxylase